MKKIFLTGSTSFLGSKFIELYSDKYQIFGTAKHDANNPIDLLDFEKLKTAFVNFKPDFVVHTSAIVDQDAEKVKIPNIKSTENIVTLAKINQTPIIFPSSESIYGGKETMGGYVESDIYKPRSVYGETKVESEKIIINSGLNYLIVRCHRFVGFNKNYNKPKQFLDTINLLLNNQEVHLDSKKLFKPCLLNNICDVFDYYIENYFDKKVILNLGVDKVTTYYDFIVDVAEKININIDLIFPDGEEKFWPENSTLNTNKLMSSGYPQISYDELLEKLKKELG